MKTYTTIYITNPINHDDIMRTQTFENSITALEYENYLHNVNSLWVTHRLHGFPKKGVTVQDVNNSRIFDLKCKFDLIGA